MHFLITDKHYVCYSNQNSSNSIYGYAMHKGYQAATIEHSIFGGVLLYHRHWWMHHLLASIKTFLKNNCDWDKRWSGQDAEFIHNMGYCRGSFFRSAWSSCFFLTNANKSKILVWCCIIHIIIIIIIISFKTHLSPLAILSYSIPD